MAERPTLSLDQLQRLVELVPPRWEAFVLLTTFASLRWGDVTAPTCADVDLDDCTVRVRRQFQTVKGGLEVGPPKSRAGLRTVSFPRAILPALVEHLAVYAGVGPGGLVFPNEHGEALRRGNFNTAVSWARICRQLGMPGLHLHDLRHTGNTMGAQSGASLRDLMTRMGHDSPAAALIYQHSNRAGDAAIAAALDARLTGAGFGAGRRPSDEASGSTGPAVDAAKGAKRRGNEGKRLGPVWGPERGNAIGH